MTGRLAIPAGCLLVALCLPSDGNLSGQVRGLEVSYGRWWRSGTSSDLYSLMLHRPWFGSVSHGIGVTHLDDRAAAIDRTHTGIELDLATGRAGGGLYAVGSSGLVMRHADGTLDAVWSAGLGYAWQPLSFLALGGDVRYRLEKDRWSEGFWRYDAARDRRGWQLQGRMALHFGSSPPRPRRPGARPPRRISGTNGGAATTPAFEPPRESEIADFARAGGASASAAEIAARVVQTAIDAMGTPYQWGGTDENGFDCSGLIQFAYNESGIIIPRVSRDQARFGAYVDRRVTELLPGDILGFSVERSSRITHVGLYIGDGKFIHSASRGVTISSLIAPDPSNRWWQRRWVVARRIL